MAKYLNDTGLTYFWGKIKTYVSNAIKVTGVKGNAESSYRTGNVNLTPANIGAQATLVSGTNIKTVNGNSLLGSGNIAISSGISKLDVYPVGAVYISVSNTSPATLFGGTWQQIKDVFLVSYGDNSDTWFALKADSTVTANSLKVYMWKRTA